MPTSFVHSAGQLMSAAERNGFLFVRVQIVTYVG